MAAQWENIISDKRLPNYIRNILEKNFLNPPVISRPGFPLFGYSIDHFAIALPSALLLRRTWMEVTDNPEIKTVDPLHLWPENLPGCPNVTDAEKKWMVTLSFGHFLLVLLAPHNRQDIIANFLRRAGKPDVHHIAYSVQDFDDKVQDINAIKEVRQISPVADDDDVLKQVFFKYEGDERIFEVILRAQNFLGTFTCKNIGILTAGELKSLKL